MKYDLECRFDSRKSFYGKAKVEEIEHSGKYGTSKLYDLYSYGTLVAKVFYSINGTIEYIYMGEYSQTTTRHQKEFFKQQGLNDKEIKELFKNRELIKE